MNKLTLILAVLFFVACENTQQETEAEESEEMVEEMTEDTEVTEEWTTANVDMVFNCNAMEGGNEYVLTLLMQRFNKSIPVDTVANCLKINGNDAAAYDIPTEIRAVADAGDYIYYSYVDNNQAVIMRSPKGSDAMTYEVHLSVPLEAAVNQPE